MNKLSLRGLIKERKTKGFTLVELIIVIAIIAILAAIAIPKFGEITRNANKKADLAAAKNIHGIVAQHLAEDQTYSATSSDDIKSEIDGEKADSKITGNAFTITIDSNKNITVSNGATGDGLVEYPVS